MSYKQISPSSPARITVFPNARTTRAVETLEFGCMEELAAFFETEPLERSAKTDAPLFSRGFCDGRRKKVNLQPPFLLMLDVDKSPVSMADCSVRLRIMDVDHVAYETWSHGKEEGTHSYRVVVDLMADSWPAVEIATRELFKLVCLEPTSESSTCPAFFVPAAEPGKVRRSVSVLAGGSDWRPS